MMTFPEVRQTIQVPNIDREIIITDLSVEYISVSNNDPSKDTVENALRDASNLDENELNALGYNTAKSIYEEIVKLTFGDKVGDGEDDGKK